MDRRGRPLHILWIVLLLALLAMPSGVLRAQEGSLEDATVEGPLFEEQPEEGILPTVPTPGEGPAMAPVTAAEAPEEAAETEEGAAEAEPVAGGAPGEGETRWGVKINAAIRAHYIFNDSPNSFVVKYRWEIAGAANAATAVIRGDADIKADVEGFLSKWPTGECKLEVAIPKVPFDLTFQKQGDDRSSVNLQFKRAITEDWQSRCTFTDAPGAHFDTRGEPEKWLARAIDKARPPLRSIIADLKDEETTASFIIGKEIIDDPPIGSVEIEGTGVVTITPGGT